MSNVVYQAEILDSRGHEANYPGECEDVRRGFCFAKEGRRQTLARCRYDELGDRLGSGENCSEGYFRPTQEVTLPRLAKGSRLDSGRDGGKGRDRPEFSGRCRAGKAECFHPQFGFDGEGPKGLAVAIVLADLILNHLGNELRSAGPRRSKGQLARTPSKVSQASPHC